MDAYSFERKIALDNAIQELRKALHLQMALCNTGEPDFEAIEQASELVHRSLEMVRRVMIPGGIETELRRRQDLRAVETELMIRQYRLDKLPSTGLAELLKLDVLPPID